MKKKSKYAQKQIDRGFISSAAKFTGKFANPRNARPTKAEYNLQRRIRDWDGIKSVKQGKSGKFCFHRPGSLQR